MHWRRHGHGGGGGTDLGRETEDLPMKVFVAGAGTMGAGIAQVFAVCTHDVMLFDVSAELAAKGRAMIETRLQKLVEKSELAAEEKLRIISRIGISTAPEDAKG